MVVLVVYYYALIYFTGIYLDITVYGSSGPEQLGWLINQLGIPSSLYDFFLKHMIKYSIYTYVLL